MSTVRVLIVDDSNLMRKLLSNIVGKDSRLTVVGTAENGADALQKIEQLQPDVVTLDLNMPVMDGITTLREANHRKVNAAFLIVSSLAQKDAQITIDAINEGAVDYIPKPSQMMGMGALEGEIISKIVMCYESRKRNMADENQTPVSQPKPGSNPGQVRPQGYGGSAPGLVRVPGAMPGTPMRPAGSPLGAIPQRPAGGGSNPGQVRVPGAQGGSNPGAVRPMAPGQGGSSPGGVRPVQPAQGGSSPGGVRPVQPGQGGSGPGGVRPVQPGQGGSGPGGVRPVQPGQGGSSPGGVRPAQPGQGGSAPGQVRPPPAPGGSSPGMQRPLPPAYGGSNPGGVRPVAPGFGGSNPGIVRAPPSPLSGAVAPGVGNVVQTGRPKLLIFGGSAGSMQLLQKIIPAVPASFTGVAVFVLHLPAFFTSQLATKLKEICPIPVEEAKDGMPLSLKRIYIAPGGTQNLVLVKNPAGKGVMFRIVENDGTSPVCPSIDVFMSTAADIFRDACRGILISGTGTDGIEGLRRVRERLGESYVQDKQSAVANQLVNAAITAGVPQRALSIPEIIELFQ